MVYFSLRSCHLCHIKLKIVPSTKFRIVPKNISVALYSQRSKTQAWEGVYADPVKLTHEELSTLHININEKLKTNLPSLQNSSHYYFDQHGKLFRPMAVNLMAKVCNFHHTKESSLSKSQKHMGMVCEMIHTASLSHDDVIDASATRRNKPSINQVFLHKQAILAGNFILSRASMILADIGNTKAVDYFSRILDDLVRGELMQLVSKDDTSERFNHYIQKTYRKTASLLAYSCSTVSLLSGCSNEMQESAFNYGKNLGIAFQLVDDGLDFMSTADVLGKPVGADILLGIATAPVLFAAEEFPDIHAMIGRRFKNEGDVEFVLDCVRRSDGVNETLMIAQKYADEAVKDISVFDDCVEKYALINLCDIVINRSR